MPRGTLLVAEPNLFTLPPEVMAKVGYDTPPFQLEVRGTTSRASRSNLKSVPRALREIRGQMRYHWF